MDNVAHLDLAARLGGYISALSSIGPRHAGLPSSVTATRAFLTASMEKLGYHVEHQQYGPSPHQVNLIAEVGSDHPRSTPILEIGAHWDTVPDSPGADDNASGVAGLLAIAQALAADPPPKARRRIRLCLFAEEEVPGCPGSTAHLARANERGDLIDGAIVLEMIGYRDAAPGSQRFPETLASLAASAGAVPAGGHLPDRGDFLAAVGDVGAEEYLTALTTAARGLGLPILPLAVPSGASGDAARSDHASYWAAGRPGVMITDTANFRNPHYHQPSDLPQTLDLDFATLTTRAVMGAIRVLTDDHH